MNAHTSKYTYSHFDKFEFFLCNTKQHCMPRLYTTITIIIITDNNIKLLLCAVFKCFFMDLYNSFLIFFSLCIFSLFINSAICVSTSTRKRLYERIKRLMNYTPFFRTLIYSLSPATSLCTIATHVFIYKYGHKISWMYDFLVVFGVLLDC